MGEVLRVEVALSRDCVVARCGGAVYRREFEIGKRPEAVRGLLRDIQRRLVTQAEIHDARDRAAEKLRKTGRCDD